MCNWVLNWAQNIEQKPNAKHLRNTFPLYDILEGEEVIFTESMGKVTKLN